MRFRHTHSYLFLGMILTLFESCQHHVIDSRQLLQEKFYNNTYHYSSLSKHHLPKLWEDSYLINDNGVPEVKFHQKYQKHPVASSQYALVCYDDYLKTKNEQSLDKFWKQVFFHERHSQKVAENEIAFPYLFDLHEYDLTAPWYSGMAQGHAVSIFIRAYRLSHEEKYMTEALQSLNFMLKDLTEGGCRTKTPEGLSWICEYPTEKVPYVLNGFVFAVIGLGEYASFSDDHQFQNLFEEYIQVLKEVIPHYEKENWLIYDRLHDKKVDDNYMGFQILQLYQLYEMTNDNYFFDKAKKWESHYDWNLFFKYFGYESPE